MHADRLVIQKFHAMGDGVLQFTPLEETVGAVVSAWRVRRISKCFPRATAADRAPTGRAFARVLTWGYRSWYARPPTAPQVGALSSYSCRGTTGGPQKRDVPPSVRETHTPAASSRKTVAP